MADQDACASILPGFLVVMAPLLWSNCVPGSFLFRYSTRLPAGQACAISCGYTVVPLQGVALSPHKLKIIY